MGSGPYLGRSWVQGGKKGANPHFRKPMLGVIFGTLGHLFRCLFSMFFWKASFSPLGRLLSAKGAQKGAKREAKWSRKRAWRYPVGSVKSMAGAVFSSHERDWGRVREATFSRLGLKTHSGGVLGSILGDFGCPLGSIWAPFWVQKGDFFQVRILG